MADFVTQKEFNIRLLIEGGIILAIFVIFSILILFIGYDFSSRAVAIQNYKQELKSATDATSVLASLKSDFERAKSYFSVLENILPIRDKLISFPKDILFVAQKNKVEAAVSFSAETPATKDAPGFIVFSMSINGLYADLLKFLQEVERGKYIIDWSDINLSFKDKQYSGTIVGRVFFQ